MLPQNDSSRQHPQDEPYNTLAIICLVSAILAWVVIPILGAIVAVVCGHIARGQLRLNPHESSSIMALIGLIIAYVQLVLAGLVLAAIVLFGWAIFQGMV